MKQYSIILCLECFDKTRRYPLRQNTKNCLTKTKFRNVYGNKSAKHISSLLICQESCHFENTIPHLRTTI